MLSIIVFVMLSTFPIKQSRASIERISWINPIYRGYDDFLGWVVGYQEGTNWEVSVMIENDWWPPPEKTQINISAIIMHFGWGKNYTHRYTTPEVLSYGETRIFTVSNMTPLTSEFPEYWTYDYRMYVEIANASSGPTEVVDTWAWWNWDYNFAIFSADHLEAQRLYDKLEMMFMGGPVMLPFLNISEAMVLFIQGYFEFQLGDQAHNVGDFSTAKTYYESADNLFNQALVVYEQKGTAMEDMTLNYKNSLTNATKDNAQANLILANASLINSYAWMFFGIGWILIGIGIIIYGARKAKPPQ